MEDNPAPRARRLINRRTFRNNFSNKHVNQTYLCYEVEVWEGHAWVPVEGLQGILSNQGLHRAELRFLDHNNQRESRHGHAVLCFLERVRSWPLDQRKHYKLTWYLSWSPSPDCVPELVAFLVVNRHVSLRIFTAGIHTILSGYERGLRDLRDAGAQLAIMTLNEHQHCWEKFVDNQGQTFNPRPELEVNIGAQCQRLEDILWNPDN